jgi:hypothetical protein
MPTMTGSGVLQTIKGEILPTHLEYRPKIPIPSISDTGKIPIPKKRLEPPRYTTLVILGVCQVGRTPVEAYVGNKQAYPGSFG